MTAPPPDPPTPLRLDGDLPRGVTVLEASAGTGKTYAIAALVTRAVAEGVCTLPEVLVVTFTRAATAELRDRVRRRLVEAADHLGRTAAAVAAGGRTTPAGDVLLDHLADADLDTLTARHGRLVAATREFDAATISTIHGFTQQILRSVGLSVELPRPFTLLEDPASLIDEVVDDVTVRRFLDHDPSDDQPAGPPGRSSLHGLATAVITRPDARVVPAPDDADPTAALLGQLAIDVRDDADGRKRARGLLGYDDLLVALREALADPTRGAQAAAVLRQRYRWALVDEFQDTDPIQWDILARAFTGDPDPASGADGDRALVLIGDPKQAIYAFRGADVATYLRATETADRRHTLGTNWRSGGALLAALEPLLDGAAFGDPRIRFRQVDAAEDHAGTAVHDPAQPEPLQLRVITEAPGGTSAAAVRQHVADDVAATVVAQLRQVTLAPDGGPLRPRGIAILVRSNAEASQVQRALRAVDVPAVVNGVGSVFSTEAATDWRWLLDGLERPADPARARRFAVSAWGGWTAADLARADAEVDTGGAVDGDGPGSFDRLHDQLHRWAQVLRDHGVATLERVVTRETAVAERLLEVDGGERRLTDLRHLGQLLHAAEQGDDRGVTGLRSWLLTRRSEADESTAPPPEDQARRLESDDEAVQILTIHRSKGLEFDVVLAPFLWGGGQSPRIPLVVDDPDGGGRLIDLGPKDRAGHELQAARAGQESVGEALRLAYVAVTRARHRAIVWWARINGTERSALARLLFRADDGSVPLAVPADLPDDDHVLENLRLRFADVPASVDPVPPTIAPASWLDPDPPPVPALSARRFDRRLDRSWRRTSYSAIVAAGGGHDAAPWSPVATEATSGLKDDEPDGDDATLATGPGDGDDLFAAHLRDVPVPLADVRGGAAFGTMIHAVLEHADFTAADLDAEVVDHLDVQSARHGLQVDAATVRVGLVAAIRSPLGPLAGHVPADDGTRWRRLCDLPRRDRLDELTFELPLAGGDAGRRGGPAPTVSRLADLLDRGPADGGLAADDPFRRARYAERLRAPSYHLDLRGYLTGAIDLVVRVPADDGTPRYLVADHKTNRVTWPDPPTLWDLRPDALAAAMVTSDYVLQALLYQVALHRYLAWRQPGYDPDRHLGGSLYLFLRGMVGPDTPAVNGEPCGVVGWRPPPRLIVDVSDLLAGEAP